MKALRIKERTAHEGALAQQQERIRVLEHAVAVLPKIDFAPKSERRPSVGFVLGPGQMHLLFLELIEAAERVADEKKVEGNVEIRSNGRTRVPSAASISRRICR